ncbi:hypothetical protein Hypma_016371 [Hypsizygus marmoreus]|uniref:Uncharacterized protein n=1 Tax=Hypsizygus marmoreus TaxID=39966 RepID=A0A369IYJ5_HYPMA|nr:hypothetical protein Hypma_016371 [Hypsizygus marmoreus]
MAAPIPPPIFILPPPPFAILPVGAYGISYDISTNATERDLPDGWNSRRARTYNQLIALLNAAGFDRHQYSDYRSLATTGFITWATMWNLRNINPPMKLESTVIGMKMQFYHHAFLFDITADLQLGGAGAPTLRGPTPANLVQQAPLMGNLLPVPAPLVAPPVPLPVHTRASQSAGVPINWMR